VHHLLYRRDTSPVRRLYLRQSLGKHFMATGEALRRGGRVDTLQMRLTNESTLIAAAVYAYMVGCRSIEHHLHGDDSRDDRRYHEQALQDAHKRKEQQTSDHRAPPRKLNALAR
jgi:hypothetical protein